MPGDVELTRVDLDERVVHHADGIVLRPLRVETRSVRHDARRNARDLDHLIAVYDGHRRSNWIAIQIEVHRVHIGAVGRNLDRRRERSEIDFADERIAIGRVLPQRAKGRAVGRRDVVVLAVGREGDAVRSKQLGGIEPDTSLPFDTRAVRSEADEGDPVVALGCYKYEIGGRWGGR